MSHKKQRPSRVTARVYDAKGRLISERQAGSVVMTYEYTEADLTQSAKIDAAPGHDKNGDTV